MGAPLVPLDLLHAIGLETWLAIFDAFGWPDGLARDASTHDAIGLALDPPPGSAPPPHPRELVAHLAHLRELASWQGREALYDAAAALAVDTAAWAHDENDAELAARLLCAAARDPDLQGVAEAARIDLRQTRRPRPFRLYAARAATKRATARHVPVAVAPADLERMAADVDAWGRTRGRRGGAIARACIDPAAPSARMVVEICRPDPPRARVTVGRAPMRDGVHPEARSSDVIVVDGARDRLAVMTHEPKLLSFHRRRMGALLHGDEEHYGTAPVLFLGKLQERGAEALDVPALRAVIARARLIRVVWDDGQRTNRTIDGPDVFAELERRGESIAGGRAIAATIRLTFAAGAPSTIDVALRIPNRVYYEPSDHDAIVEAFLEASGLTSPDDHPPDLWSLAPWLHRRRIWEALLGADGFAAFVGEGLLVRTQSRAIEHPDHEHAGRPLIAFPFRDGHYGVSEDEDVSSAVLAADALETWQLDPVALGRRLAKGLGLEGEVRAAPPIDGLVDLGRRQVGPGLLHVFMATSRPRARALHETIGALVGAARPVLLVPPGRAVGGPWVEVGFTPAGPYGAVLRDVLLASKLDRHVEALLVAPETARVVIDEARELAWLDGVKLTLNGAEHAMLAALASAHGALVGYEEIAKAVGSGPRDGSGVPKLKGRLVLAIRESFEATRRAVPTDFERLIVAGTKRGYRLTVEAFVR